MHVLRGLLFRGGVLGAVFLEDGSVLFKLPIRPESVRDEGNVADKQECDGAIKIQEQWGEI